jgi:hypothetical protein
MPFILAEDAALKSLLSGMTVIDEKAGGSSTPRAVQVWYGTPDIELREQKFPFITIDLMDIRLAPERQMSGVIYDRDKAGTVVANNTNVYGYEYPVTYDLVYQVTSYARHPRHDRSLIQQLMQVKFPSKYGKLGIVSDSGVETTYRHMFLDEFLKRDTVEEGRRLLRNIFLVRVVSELTHYDANAAKKKVAAVEFNTITTHIPSGKLPI